MFASDTYIYIYMYSSGNKNIPGSLLETGLQVGQIKDCGWPVLPQETMLRYEACADPGGHVDVYGS